MLPYASIHPKLLKSMKPEDRPKQEAPKIDRSAPSLKVMRAKIIEKKPSAKEVGKYLEEVIERLTDAREKEDDGES
jgi:hypothetical protein